MENFKNKRFREFEIPFFSSPSRRLVARAHACTPSKFVKRFEQACFLRSEGMIPFSRTLLERGSKEGQNRGRGTEPLHLFIHLFETTQKECCDGIPCCSSVVKGVGRMFWVLHIREEWLVSKSRPTAGSPSPPSPRARGGQKVV